MADQDSSARIAIRFGGSSKEPQNVRRPKPSSALGKRHRSTFDDDSDSDSNESGDAQHETITHFGAEGAENIAEKTQDRDERRTSDHHAADANANAPGEDHPAGSAERKEAETDETEEPLKYGLTISKKPRQTEKTEPVHLGDGEATREPKTADEQAMDALLGKEPAKPRLLHRTEDEAYRDATASAPEVDDLATYDAIPVEGFGASLLKGQGWDGKMRGPKSKEIKKRPNGMGLGAKKLKVEEDLGSWDSKGKSERRPRLDEYRRESDRERSRRDGRYRDSYKNERDRERDRDRNYERNRHSSSRNDRDFRR